MQSVKFIKHKSIIFFVIIAASLGILRTQSNAQDKPPDRDRNIIREIYNLETSPEDVWIDVESADDQYLDATLTTDALPNWGRFVFQTYRDGHWVLVVMDENGDEFTLDTEFDGYYPDLNSNGSEVVFSVRSSSYSIRSISTENHNEKILTRTPHHEIHAAYSPTHDEIIYQSTQNGNYDIFIMDTNGNGQRALTTSPAYDGEPAWSPDGNQIVFVSNRTGFYDLWIMNADGSDQHQITYGLSTITPSWSPSGNKIAFGHDSDTNSFYEVWTISIEGSNLKQISDISSRVDHWSPVWSPDGNWLAYISTNWILYDGNWYWNKSRLARVELDQYYFDEIYDIPDDRIWIADWAANDVLPPEECNVISSQNRTSSNIPLQFTAQDQGSGINTYDSQYRLPGGSWQDIATFQRSDGAVYYGNGIGQVEFRCRAYDYGNNSGPWTSTPVLSPDVDAINPQSDVHISDQLIRGSSVQITWDGMDAGSGIDNYSIFYRDGLDGNWVRWLDEANDTSGVFTSESGHTYYFRSQATDQAGNLEPWSPVSQADVTFYSSVLTTTLTDLRGNLISGPEYTLQPSAAFTSTGMFYLSDAITHTLTVTEDGYETLPPAQITTEADKSFHWVMTPVDNSIINGGFENGTLDGWNSNGITITNLLGPGHTGQYTLEMESSLTETVSISQSLLVENDAYYPTLSFMYQTSDDMLAGDFKLEIANSVTSTMVNVPTTDGNWDHYWTDLTDYPGSVITLTLEISGDTNYVLLDEVTVGEWKNSVPISVDPEQWLLNKPANITISGQNFLPSASVYLNDIQIEDATWVSPTLLTAKVPSGIPSGHYDLNITQEGIQSTLADVVEITSYNVHLPAVINGYMGGNRISSDWPMSAYDEQRTGYNRGELGGSKYVLEWEYELPDYEYIYPYFVLADNIVVILTHPPYKILALDATQGDILWSHGVPGRPDSSLTIANDRVYYSTYYSEILYCLDLHTGDEMFQAEIPDNSTGTSMIFVNDKIYTENGVWDASTGYQLRNPYLDYTVNLGFQAAYANNTLYTWGYSQNDGNIFRVYNPQTGGLLWTFIDTEYRDRLFYAYPVIGKDLAILNRAYSSRPLVVDLNTHGLKWVAPIEPENWLGNSTIADNRIYSMHGTLSVWDAETGDFIWGYEGVTESYGKPVITKNYIYIYQDESWDPTIQVIDRQTHELVYEIPYGGNFIVTNGFVYMIGEDDVLRAFRATLP